MNDSDVDRAALVPVAKILRPHGIHGQLKVHVYNSDSETLTQVSEVWLGQSPQAAKRLTIAVAKRVPKGMLMGFEGCDSRTQAEALRGLEVYLPRAALPELADDEYYHVDLIGMQACSPEGDVLGTVADVLDYPSVSCLRVVGSHGAKEVPLLDDYVAIVDVPGQRLIVRHWEQIETQPD